MKLQIDITFGMIVFFGLVIAMLILTSVFVNQIFNGASFNSLRNNNPTTNAIITHGVQTFTAINNILAFLYIFIGIASIVASAFTEVSPVFAVVAIILIPLQIYLAMVFHDAFFGIIQNSSLGAVANQYPTIITIFQYYPIITMVISLILLIVTFAKS